MYIKPIFKMKTNGWLSKTCPMTRGIRQGCPLSALLYLFVAEILSSKINFNQDIKGITINNCEIKNIQHADDLSLTIKHETSMEHALNILNEFCENAGSKINKNKTECILLGTLKNLYYKLFGIKITNKAVRCLGIFIGHDKEECYNNNWMKIYHDIEFFFNLGKEEN